jgi:ATP-dependent helicase/nuclease subunit B
MGAATAPYLELDFPIVTLAADAAGEIVRRFAGRLPDLSSVTILLPQMQAALGFRAAVQRAAAREVLLLPRFATFATLGANIPLPRSVAAPSLRLAQIYTALKSRGWFDAPQLWGIAAELAQLFDELTRAQTQLPDSVEAFTQRLQEIYQSKPDPAMHFEARLAYELWHAFHGVDANGIGAALDAALARQLQLAALAISPPGPLCTVGLPRMAPFEAEFLRRYAERQSVLVMNGDESVGADPLTAGLAAAWVGPEASAEELHARAIAFRATHEVSPLARRVSCHAALSLEDEALAAAGAMRAWVGEGKRAIALVAADRLTARRVRALLERDQILLSDESGWTLSTTSASTVVMRLLDCVGDRFNYRDVLDLLKSPFFATDWEPGRRKAAVHRLEAWRREANLIAGLDRWQSLVEKRAATGDEAEIIRRLAKAQKHLQVRGQTLASWLDRLRDALAALGALPGLEDDAAGRQLLALLVQRREDLAGHGERLGAMEWRRWLNAEFEGATFRDDSIDSPIVLTTLAGTRLRAFEAVVVVGGDARHLAARTAPTRMFNQAVRTSLGLESVAEIAQQIQRDLAGLISRAGSVLVTWQSVQQGEHNAASPWITRLQVFHQITYGNDLSRPAASARIAMASEDQMRGPPAPTVPPALLPGKISASAYASLVVCPYQFYARHVLRLNERDDGREEMEKRHYGELVHEILARFHRACPHVCALAEPEAEANLRATSEAVFSDYVKNDFSALAWQRRWERVIPRYLAWQRLREQDGWRFHDAEQSLECALALGDGRDVRLHGRVDRIDEHATAGLAVLDYKTQKKNKLVRKLATPGEDVQLGIYGLLAGDAVSQAAYVGLDDERGVVSVAMEADVGPMARAEAERLVKLLDAIAHGAPMPAQGTPEACSYCEMRGLCRRDYWPGQGEAT